LTLQDDFIKCYRGEWTTIGHLQFRLEGRTLYFQCTRGKEDTKSNLNFKWTHYNGMYVHAGFLAMWLAAREVILSLDFDEVRGYSQGGVFASLTALEYKRKIICIVFGCPRFLWMPKRMYRDAHIIRIENPWDWVTKLPFAILGYRHIGKRIKLKNRGGKPSHIHLLYWLTGHSENMYLQNLEGLLCYQDKLIRN